MGVSFISVGLFAVNLGLYNSQKINDPLRWWVCTAIAVAPAWIAGIVEDVTHRVPPGLRLLATATSAVLLAIFLELRVVRTDFSILDSLLGRYSFLGTSLAVLAILAMTHAFNIIDGYNGLASTVTMMILIVLAYVAMKVGDWHYMAVFVILLGATIAFWFWNYPRGLLFIGDGGAYLWGIVIAVGSIALVQRNEAVSPWFPVLLLAYPILEVVFSTYRKIARGQSPSIADALHLHQLIYRRIVRATIASNSARQMLLRNSRTSPYLWGVAIIAVMPAMLFWQNTEILIPFFVGFAFLYVILYVSIVRFKVPKWLKR